ncbi:MAG: BrnT family toxin, partial [Clostridiales Family XIII bacterium]|nr:BrnT family toxin [Clostridiales Family XIII bacterium]
MNYVWDEEKRIANLRKHNFDFKDAGSVFNDPHGIETVDDRFDYGEERIMRIGLYRSEIVTVVIFV